MHQPLLEPNDRSRDLAHSSLRVALKKDPKNQGFKLENWSDKLHLGSDWPVRPQINLSLRAQFFVVFLILSRSPSMFMTSVCLCRLVRRLISNSVDSSISRSQWRVSNFPLEQRVQVKRTTFSKFFHRPARSH